MAQQKGAELKDFLLALHLHQLLHEFCCITLFLARDITLSIDPYANQQIDYDLDSGSLACTMELRADSVNHEIERTQQ